MHVTIVGLGLIGGSIARSLRASPEARGWTIDGWSPRAQTRRAALESGAIDAAVGLEEAVRSAELLVLAAPPLACLDLLDELGGPLRGRLDPAATITDVASTKSAIVARAESRGLRFVGGHPMAGRETAGFAASTSDLFSDRPWVVVPGVNATARDVDRVRALAATCGARAVQMDAAAHDEAVASISHVPLILSAALVEAVCGGPNEGAVESWPLAASLAAGGWRDMTRIARGDPAMGAGIAATNAVAITPRLRRLRGFLDEWLSLLEEPDSALLEGRFASARSRVSTEAESATEALP